MIKSPLLPLIIILFSLTACSRENSYQGYIEGEFINLSTTYSGKLERLAVSRGNLVKKGQLLYIQDLEPQASDLLQAKAQLQQEENRLLDLLNGQRRTVLDAIIAQKEQAEAKLQFSIKTLNRYRQLYKQGVIDKASVDQAQSDYDNNLNQVNQYQSNLEEAKLGARQNAIQAQEAAVAAANAATIKAAWELQQKTTVAPTEGIIFDTYYKVGEFVNTQQVVLALLSPYDVKVVFYIPEPKRSILSLGEVIYFSCDQCKTRMQATINYISPEAEYTPPVIYSRESREKLVYRVEAALALTEAKQLHPGQPIDVYLK